MLEQSRSLGLGMLQHAMSHSPNLPLGTIAETLVEQIEK
jgi:hypothetical protein